MSEHIVPSISLNPPPPPPSGAPPLHSITTTVAKHLKNAQCSNQTDIDVDTEVRNLCEKLQKSSFARTDGRETENYYIAFHKDKVLPVIQEGPKCGIVAISMTSQLLGTRHLEPEDIYNAALMLGYTKQGEIFSAVNLLSLAKSQLQCSGCTMGGTLLCRRKELVHQLMKGNSIIIPYDRDHNNEPCCKRGQKAHWAVLSGFVIQVTDHHKEQLTKHTIQNKTFSSLYHIRNGKHFFEKTTSDFLDCGSCRVHVFANQGKSLRTHLWDLDTLLESNEQLMDVDPEIAADINNFVVGNLSAELNAKFVVLYKHLSE